MVARLPHDHRHPGVPLFALALVALAVGVGAYPVVRRLTSRLERLQAGVESLGAGELSARVKVEGSDEVARLAGSFNRAAGRIEELVGAHKALLANASHELRTPLARIRMAVELMKESADPKRKAELEQDITELDALIDEILLASRLDAVKHLDTIEEVDLLALVAEECARYENTGLDGQTISVRGDPRLLRRKRRADSGLRSRPGRPRGRARARVRAVLPPYGGQRNHRRGAGARAGAADCAAARGRGALRATERAGRLLYRGPAGNCREHYDEASRDVI